MDFTSCSTAFETCCNRGRNNNGQRFQASPPGVSTDYFSVYTCKRAHGPVVVLFTWHIAERHAHLLALFPLCSNNRPRCGLASMSLSPHHCPSKSFATACTNQQSPWENTLLMEKLLFCSKTCKDNSTRRGCSTYDPSCVSPAENPQHLFSTPNNNPIQDKRLIFQSHILHPKTVISTVELPYNTKRARTLQNCICPRHHTHRTKYTKRGSPPALCFHEKRGKLDFEPQPITSLSPLWHTS